MSETHYRDLPAVDVIVGQISTGLPRALVVDAARLGLNQARRDIAAGRAVEVLELVREIVRGLERSSGRTVINATGVLLHTNLGRAPWSEKAIEAAAAAARSYTNVEIDIDTGRRSKRGGHVTRLLRELTGADDSIVVNNNAAALLLALASTSAGRAVPVARGELIEIGGSYRLPDVMTASGCRLVEVGTTNRTRVGDYQVALQTHDCAAILKVHPSNYQVVGFVEDVGISDLRSLGDAYGLPVIYDIGSGLLDSSMPWVPNWLNKEPAARQSIESGADLVTFSGDKLLGGPQAGLIVGSDDVIARLRGNPLARALRVDGPTYAAIAATLESYLTGDPTDIPFWRYSLAASETLQTRSDALAGRIGARVEMGASAVGAGSAPGMTIPGPIVRVDGADAIYECLLAADTPVLARRDDGDLLIDLRAVEPADDETIAEAIARCL